MKFFVSCAKGTEGALRREMTGMGIRGPRGETGGVSFEGRFDEAMRVCLWSRVGMRVLQEVGAFPSATADELYAGVRALPWHEHLDARSTLAVSASVQENANLIHSGFAALKVKDAVVDALRDRLGARPDVNSADPDVALFLHLRGSEASVFLDLAGEPLHRRGYRVAMTEAPMKETLAAAVLALGGVDLDAPFLDPMAGSGTLAIEHALRARGMAPGLNRRFGFERWPSQTHKAAWDQLREDARARALPEAPMPILARDVSTEALAAARRNAETAGVAADITFQTGDVRQLAQNVPRGPGTLCMNPPYGERLSGAADEAPPSRPGPRPRFAPPASARFAPPASSRFAPPASSRFAPPASSRPGGPQARSGRFGQRPGAPTSSSGDNEALNRLYRDMARAFAQVPDWKIALLCGNPLLARAMGRNPDISHRLWNGPLEVRLLVYRAVTAA